MANRNYELERRWRNMAYASDWDYDYDESGYRYYRGPYPRWHSGRRYQRVYDYGDYESEYPSTWAYTRYGWWTPGQYTGVGPRGYRRSDERIREDVNERLMQHGQVDASDIQVEVNDGIVMLSGSVDTRREKRMAEDVAESVSGVWDVDNRLSVRRPGRTQSDVGCQAREGMEVVGRDGNPIGTVKQVRDDGFLVDRPAAGDIYVPFSECLGANGQIQLRVRADEVDAQGWRSPAFAQSHGNGGQGR